MLNDERPHVNQANEAGNMEVLRQWRSAIEEHCKSVDGSVPEIVVAGRTGIVTRPKDPASLARGIAFMLDHPQDAARMAEILDSVGWLCT